MERVEYGRLREHERGYWWHVGRRALLASVLRGAVPPDPRRPGLDVGCGTGENFALLAPYGRFVGSEVARELYAGQEERPPRPVVLARGEALPFRDGSLGICTFFDVLEHVEFEDAFLREIGRVLRPGGWVLLSVPAYPFLWSDHDVSLHHYRRYVRGTLREVLRRNGFGVVRMSYAFATVAPVVAGYRLLSRLLPRRGAPRTSYVATPGPINRMLVRLLELEARWLARFDLPFGISLFALARKEAA